MLFSYCLCIHGTQKCSRYRGLGPRNVSGGLHQLITGSHEMVLHVTVAIRATERTKLFMEF